MNPCNKRRIWQIILFAGAAAAAAALVLAGLGRAGSGTEPPPAVQQTTAPTRQPEQNTSLPTEPEASAETPAETEAETQPAETLPTEKEQTLPPVTEATAPPDTQPAEPEAPVEESGLRFDQFSLFTGQFVEDGRDEPAENVAAILVTNTTDRFLDLATMAFEIDGKLAAFVATGLPAGRSAWVLELSGLRAEADAEVNYLDCISSFRDGVQNDPEEIGITARGNMLTVENRSEQKLEGIFIYYRTLHTDGNFLGGITYVVEANDLEPGQSREILAGHYDEANSEIVRIGWKDQ